MSRKAGNILRFGLRLILDIAAAFPTFIFVLYLYGFDVAPWPGVSISLVQNMLYITPLIFGLVNSVISLIVLSIQRLSLQSPQPRDWGIVPVTVVVNVVTWLAWAMVNLGIVSDTFFPNPVWIFLDGTFLLFSLLSLVPLLFVSLLTSRFLPHKAEERR